MQFNKLSMRSCDTAEPASTVGSAADLHRHPGGARADRGPDDGVDGASTCRRRPRPSCRTGRTRPRARARAASTAASTWARVPVANGSTVNSTRNAIAVHPNAVLLRGGIVLDVDGERARRPPRRTRRAHRRGRRRPRRRARRAVVDCAGRLVVPGGVDVHTHLHLPVGEVRVSDDFVTGTVAAAIGGTTTIVDYVTAYRGEDPLDALATWRPWAEPACVDYGLHMTFTERVPERVVADCVEAGVTSFKLYMAYPELLQVDDDVIARHHAHARASTAGSSRCTARTAARSRRCAAQALAEGRTGVMEHALTRPAELEAEAVTRAAALAERAGASVYVGAPVVGAGARRGARGARARRRRARRDVPAVPVPRHRAARRSRRRVVRVHAAAARPVARRGAVARHRRTGTVQTVATDHCPFTVADRRAGVRARAEGYARLHRDPRRPARHRDPHGSRVGGRRRGPHHAAPTGCGCARRRRRARSGSGRPRATCASAPTPTSWCGIRHGPQSLDAGALHMAVDHSPYEGMTVTGWPELVLSRGDVVARDGAVRRRTRPRPTSSPAHAPARFLIRRSGVARAAIAAWRVKTEKQPR